MAIDAQHVPPDLPLELERVILQMADRLIPILYKVVVLSTQAMWPPLPLPIAKLPQYGRYVQHLLIGSARDKMIGQYLKYCPNIIDFASGMPLSEPQMKLVDRLPLHQLYLNFYNSSASPSTLILFSQVTHLDAAALDLSLLPHFTSLTHLVLGSNLSFSVYVDILKQYSRLKVLMVWDIDVSNATIFPQLQREIIPGFDDTRIVRMKCRKHLNWRMKALGDTRNAWSFAERVVEERSVRPRAQISS
ncbi:hypothetical protein BDN72DRAFT_956156 [Pluteus cervinus]|uniref:Uncharacterized protein n=1 Tax=Pluteus cervinus TaxID=181527 RepID=A0ACD3B9X3_9AGAR|nr:hypothetical protein BDN72DRAFT_956156 [Pluteus cervinus]